MRRMPLVALILLCSSIAHADTWYAPSNGVCGKSDFSPKEIMDLITKLGGEYEVSDSGGAKPSMVFIESETLKALGTTIGGALFFRTKKDCDAAA